MTLISQEISQNIETHGTHHKLAQRNKLDNAAHFSECPWKCRPSSISNDGLSNEISEPGADADPESRRKEVRRALLRNEVVPKDVSNNRKVYLPS